MSSDIAKLICSTILLDTFNFNKREKDKRWFDEDQ